MHFVRGFLVSFHKGPRQMVVLIGIHDINALVSQKKHLYPSFFLESKFVLKTGRTSIVDRIQFIFARGQDKWVVLIGIHDIDALVSQKKKRSIGSLRFVQNQGLSLKHDEHHPWIESSFFSRGAKTNDQFSLVYRILMNWFRKKKKKSICSLRFVWNKVCPYKGMDFIRAQNQVSFCEKARQMGSSHWDT